MYDVLFWPIIACVLLPWLLVYLGLHVVQRGIIFIDIAMAQIASLGICFAMLSGRASDDWRTFAIALIFTLLAAILFAVTGRSASAVPQEAIMGIAYVVAAAASILLLSRSAHGNEQIRKMLIGDIAAVDAGEVWRCLALFAAAGAIHYWKRKAFLLVSFDPDRARQRGLRLRWWDFLFYALFGLAVTSFVRVAGVLLVFSYLIVPAVIAVTLTRRIGLRLLIGWLVSVIGGIAGLYLSFYGKLPSGAAIACTFGALLALVAVATLFRRQNPERLV